MGEGPPIDPEELGIEDPNKKKPEEEVPAVEVVNSQPVSPEPEPQVPEAAEQPQVAEALTPQEKRPEINQERRPEIEPHPEAQEPAPEIINTEPPNPQIVRKLQSEKETIGKSTEISRQAIKSAYHESKNLIMTSGGWPFHGEIWVRDLGYMMSAALDRSRGQQLTPEDEEFANRLMHTALYVMKEFQAKDGSGTMPLRVEEDVNHRMQFAAKIFPPFKWLGLHLRKKPEAMYENTRGQLKVRDATAIFVSAMLQLARKMPQESTLDAEGNKDASKATKFRELIWEGLTEATTFTTAKPEVAENWAGLREAMAHEEAMVNPYDGLIMGDKSQDWADSIGGARSGELALVNLENLDALRRMSVGARDMHMEYERLASELDPEKQTLTDKQTALRKTYLDRAASFKTQSGEYRERAKKLRSNIMKFLWDEKDGYVRARCKAEKLTGPNPDKRFDTMANVCAITSGFANAEQSRRILERMEKMKTPCGLYKNFDPPYAWNEVMGRYYAGLVPGYHNHDDWIWVGGEVGRAYLKAAKLQKDPELKAQYQNQAADIFLTISRINAQNGTAYEMVHPDTGEPTGSIIKKSTGDFVGSAVSYLKLKNDLQVEGLLPSEETEQVAVTA